MPEGITETFFGEGDHTAKVIQYPDGVLVMVLSGEPSFQRPLAFIEPPHQFIGALGLAVGFSGEAQAFSGLGFQGHVKKNFRNKSYEIVFQLPGPGEMRCELKLSPDQLREFLDLLREIPELPK